MYLENIKIINVSLNYEIIKEEVLQLAPTSFPSARKSIRTGTTISAVIGNLTPHWCRAFTSSCWYVFVFSVGERIDGVDLQIPRFDSITAMYQNNVVMQVFLNQFFKI